MTYIEFIEESLRLASQIATSYFGKVKVTTKTGDNNQVLTKADLAIGKIIVNSIKKMYPKDNIIDEEAGIIDKHSDFTWVIDPIDGTSNFAQGVPTYGITIGLLKETVPLVGGIALPFFSEIYLAFKGKGSQCNGKRTTVTQEQNLLKTLVVYAIDSNQENPELTRNECRVLAEVILNIRNLRISNSTFDIAMVAWGKYGGYINKTSKIWDNVAQQVILEEAGGLYTDYFGKPIDYSLPLGKVNDNFTCCTAAPQLHNQLQEIIRKFY